MSQHSEALSAMGFDPLDLLVTEPHFRGRWVVLGMVVFCVVSMLFQPGILLNEGLAYTTHAVKLVGVDNAWLR